MVEQRIELTTRAQTVPTNVAVKAQEYCHPESSPIQKREREKYENRQSCQYHPHHDSYRLTRNRLTERFEDYPGIFAVARVSMT